ncbi:MAG: ArsR/SmtB family transcription factor [Nostocoides sp.]
MVGSEVANDLTLRRHAKDRLFAAVAQVAHALGNGRRAELIDVLMQGERSVDELAREISQSISNTSQHLRVLRESGLVTVRRDGQRVFHAIAGEEVGALWRLMLSVASERVDAVEELTRAYVGDRDSLSQLTREGLLQRLEAGEVTVLDVRPYAEWVAGHIPGAVSIPPHRMTELLDALPKDGRYVAYCRGPICVFADDAVRYLESQGMEGAILTGGFPQWRADGLPVEEGDPDRTVLAEDGSAPLAADVDLP